MATTKILVFGPNGWLGSKIIKFFNAIPSDLRVKDYYGVAQELERYRPDVVINAIGKKMGGGSNNIDGCLDERVETMFTNITVPAILSQTCREFDCYFVHISTGCLWNAYPPDRLFGFREADKPAPNSFYSETKVQAEILVRQNPKSLILRPRMPFDGMSHKGNLLTKLMSFKSGLLIDAPNSMTCVDDFLEAMGVLIERGCVGTFHVVNPAPLRHIEILRLCYESGLLKEMPQPELLIPDEFHSRKITRDGRSNCILDTSKLSMHTCLISTEEAVKRCLAKYKNY